MAEIAHGTVAENRRARYDYFIEDSLEAGIMLVSTEVKSMRGGQASLNESHAGEMDGELYLFNAYVPEYSRAGPKDRQHEPRRPRKLLVHRKEMDKLLGAIRREGMTLIPVSLYFNDRGIAKIKLGLAKGKKQHDKRQTEKTRDWNREKSRLMKEKG